MLTLLLPRDAKSFRISHQEMIKGIRLGGNGKTLRFFDTLEVPIIENTADEEDLSSGMAEAMEKYPNAAAILVRRHGVYIWGTFEFHRNNSNGPTRRVQVGGWTADDLAGNTWQQAKTQAECLDYLFEIAVKMLLAKIPLEGDA